MPRSGWRPFSAAGFALALAGAPAARGSEGRRAFLEAPSPGTIRPAFRPGGPLGDPGPVVARTLQDVFLDPADHLFRNFHLGGNFGVALPNVYGPPYSFVNTGSDKLSAWNAFVALALLHQGERGKDPALRRIAEETAAALHERCRDPATGSYPLVCGDPANQGMVTDAIVGTLFLRLALLAPRGPYRAWARDLFRGLVDQYLPPSAPPRCCRVGGSLVEALYSRDALTVGGLAWAAQVLREPTFRKSAVRLADTFLDRHYRDGHFVDWENIGTDSEMGLGLLLLYRQTRDRRYLAAAEGLVPYWERHVGDRPQSIVDLAEHVAFLERLSEIPGHSGAPARARAVWRTIEPCLSRSFRAFPYVCGPDAHYYSAINAIAILALP